MAFSDDLARDPKSDNEFWTIIEDTFVQVKSALTDYPVETRDEALAAPYAAATSKTHHFPSFGIAECDKDLDSRDYFLELGRRFLPESNSKSKPAS